MDLSATEFRKMNVKSCRTDLSVTKFRKMNTVSFRTDISATQFKYMNVISFSHIQAHTFVQQRTNPGCVVEYLSGTYIAQKANKFITMVSIILVPPEAAAKLALTFTKPALDAILLNI